LDKREGDSAQLFIEESSVLEFFDRWSRQFEGYSDAEAGTRVDDSEGQPHHGRHDANDNNDGCASAGGGVARIGYLDVQRFGKVRTWSARTGGRFDHQRSAQ